MAAGRQRDPGVTIDSPLGTRQATTLRNEPMRRPNTTQIATSTEVTVEHTVAGAG